MDVVAGAIAHSVPRTVESCRRLRAHFDKLAPFAETLSFTNATFIYGSRFVGTSPPSLLRDGSSLSVAVGHLVNKAELSRQLGVSCNCSISNFLGEAWLK